MKVSRIVFTLLTILLMCCIFWFSSKPADISTEMSNEVGMFVGRIVVPEFNEMPESEQQEYAESIDFYVRKSAHAAEYLLLSVLCSITLILWFREHPYLLILLGFLITVFYAETDEIHQSYVPGRACMLSDIMIDSAGAAAGALLTALACMIIFRRHPLKK
ncbi:MAG: VanZ family protein [Parasporobacterium sp.]|nr:VanZ family protein [Parasporobacterium sp.]